MTSVLLAITPTVTDRVIIGFVLIVLLVCMFLFHSLNVEITTEYVTVWFGPGLIRKSFQLREIHDAQIVRNPWYYGWGARWIPRGWLYNVSGFDAVELQLKGHRRFRIGTDEPEQLLAAIKKALEN